MPIAAGSLPAFRCRSCGHLVGSESAAEREVPPLCPVCHKGVTFAPNGTKTYQPENWEVLADATPDRLAELGLSAETVTRHVPLSREESLQQAVETCKANLAALAAKREHWEFNKDQIIQEFNVLEGKAAELDKQIEAAAQNVPQWEKLTNERGQVWQRLNALADLEPSPRDAAYQAHLESALKQHEAALSDQSGTPQTLKLQARDGARARDRS